MDPTLNQIKSWEIEDSLQSIRLSKTASKCPWTKSCSCDVIASLSKNLNLSYESIYGKASKKNDFITFGSDWVSESDKNIVKLCVHFVSVCLKVQKWRQTETKVTFHPPENFFLSQMKGMAKIRLFYSGAMALILPQ